MDSQLSALPYLQFKRFDAADSFVALRQRTESVKCPIIGSKTWGGGEGLGGAI